MMVPRLRLIFLSGAILLPAGIAAAWQSSSTGIAAAAAVLLLAAAVGDMVLSRGVLRGVRVRISDVVRLTVDHDARIPLWVVHSRSGTLRLRVGLALPRTVASARPDLRMDLDPEIGRLQSAWPCRAGQRGRFMLERCHLEAGSRLGLWAVRRMQALNSEIRVYPNLVSGRENLRGLFQRGAWGLKTLRRVGRGREFEQLREYLPGDSFEDIEWKATARRRHPITKVYQVEQAQEIYVLLDASRLSTRSAAYVTDRRHRSRAPESVAETTIFDRYIIATLIMALVADKHADRFGLLIFGDKPEGFLKAGRGRAHYNACRDMLYNRAARTTSPDFDELFTFVGSHMRKRALLVFLTSLDDPMLAESFVRAMQITSRRHILMVNMFRPPGAHPLFSSPDIHQIQGIYQHLVGHMLWSSINETQRQLKQHGAGFHLLDKDRLCSQLVSQYMDVKQRQLI